MAERKPSVPEKRIVRIVGTLTKSGLVFNEMSYKFVEKDKTYWLDGGLSRVAKSNFMNAYSRLNNDIKILQRITMQIWCFDNDIVAARRLLTIKIFEVVRDYHRGLDAMNSGIMKYLKNHK